MGEMNDKEIEAVALITFRAVWARRLKPDELFEQAWKGVREEEIFRSTFHVFHFKSRLPLVRLDPVYLQVMPLSHYIVSCRRLLCCGVLGRTLVYRSLFCYSP